MAEHADTIGSIYAAFGRGDVAHILDRLADDVEWESWSNNRAQQGGVPWLAPKHGKAGAAEFFQCVAAQMQIRDFQVLAILSGANQVAAEIMIEADIVATGRRVRDEEMHLWRLNAEGKVTRFRHYVDTAKHLEAAGLNG